MEIYGSVANDNYTPTYSIYNSVRIQKSALDKPMMSDSLNGYICKTIYLTEPEQPEGDYFFLASIDSTRIRSSTLSTSTAASGNGIRTTPTFRCIFFDNWLKACSRESRPSR